MSTINGDITATIELARGGDRQAFAQIVRQYQSLVSGVLFSATGDFHKSEDFTQETFLIAWQKLGELRDADHLAAWLCTIARNLVYRSHRKPSLPTEPLTAGTDETASPQMGPDAELLRREQSEFVWSAIGEIDEKYRETLVLYYRSGQSVREIAAVTGSTEEAVRQRLVRARQSLKAKIEEMVGDILTDTIPGEAFTLAVMTALGTAMLTSTAQAGAAATTGTAIGTGGATTGKVTGTATIWSVLGPAAIFGWFVAIIIVAFWAGVRNTPTLRSRRFRVHSIFWSLQYYGLFAVSLGVGIGQLIWAFPKLNFAAAGSVFHFPIMFILCFMIAVQFQMASQRKMKGIIENDLDLPGPRIESYSYSQVERRFFLSLITNLLLTATTLALFIGVALFEGRNVGDTMHVTLIVGFITGVAVITAVYYPLGRYFLKICRTKQNFLAAPPLVDNPFEVALQKTGKVPASVDHPRKTGGMFGIILLVWIGYIGGGVWYFSQYSWDKHPIPLGICAVFAILIFGMSKVLIRKIKSQRGAASVNILQLLCIVALALVLEFIEFGGIGFSDLWTKQRDPRNLIHFMNLTALLICPCHLLLQCHLWFKAKQEESDDKVSGKETLLQEAIARYDPVTMIADEPEVCAKPFPRRWLWILGLYAAAIVMMFCVGVLVFQ